MSSLSRTLHRRAYDPKKDTSPISPYCPDGPWVKNWIPGSPTDQTIHGTCNSTSSCIHCQSRRELDQAKVHGQMVEEMQILHPDADVFYARFSAPSPKKPETRDDLWGDLRGRIKSMKDAIDYHVRSGNSLGIVGLVGISEDTFVPRLGHNPHLHLVIVALCGRWRLIDWLKSKWPSPKGAGVRVDRIDYRGAIDRVTKYHTKASNKGLVWGGVHPSHWQPDLYRSVQRKYNWIYYDRDADPEPIAKRLGTVDQLEQSWLRTSNYAQLVLGLYPGHDYTGLSGIKDRLGGDLISMPEAWERWRRTEERIMRLQRWG